MSFMCALTSRSVDLLKGKIEIGQEAKARFQTLPALCERGKKSQDDVYPVRSGIITYIHPQNRFACVTTHTGGGDITEAFKPWEVQCG